MRRMMVVEGVGEADGSSVRHLPGSSSGDLGKEAVNWPGGLVRRGRRTILKPSKLWGTVSQTPASGRHASDRGFV